MNERAAFEKFLNEHEDDATARLAFVDWLDEQGEHEEAERHRQWPAAKAWLVRFCEVNNQDAIADPDLERAIPYKELLDLGREAFARIEDLGADEERDYWISCGNNESMCFALRMNPGDFWKNWSIVTGIPLPADVAEKSSFSCGC